MKKSLFGGSPVLEKGGKEFVVVEGGKGGGER